ncbi:ABC transporter permease [Aeromicrobium ginsengisoli]|uniref:ABC transporter permease n=1 Tax=Aeromicrobium ginsengisoli TaxID=363867 RepID=A0A5M4FJB0_9ACTN|nr:ABC transporter permease [Aeromicrobium ginsengisoli]KAA1400254.1 ABC transporter permease [Aeromicrobium ginsengisoli]
MNRLHLRQDVTIPAVVLAVTAVAFFVSPAISGATLTSFSVFNVFQQLAWLAPLTLALGITLMCGEFDLSVAGIAPLAAVLAIRFGDESPYVGAAAALGVGLVIGLVQGVLVSRLQISSVPVTMATYIALTGGTLWASGNQILSYDNSDVALWITKPVMTVLSPGTLIAGALALAIGLAMGLTTWGRDSRAVGSDRRAARASGVRVDAVLVLAFTSSGALAACSGVLLSFSTASANPNPDIKTLVLAVVAALAGGATLKGGRGRVVGILAGALAICFLQAIFSVNALEDSLSQFLFATLLLAVAAADAPDLARSVSRLTSARIPTGEPS